MSTIPAGRSANGRGNLSFTSINLPRIAIKAHGDVDVFFEELDRKMDLVIDQLLRALRDPVPQKECATSPS